MDARIPAVLEPEASGGFFVRFVDVEGAMTDGETLDEALFNASEALWGILGWMLDENRPIPEPSPAGDGRVLVAPTPGPRRPLLIRRARGERSLAELARSLETSWPSAQRLENPRHSPTLRQLEKAAAALGKRLVPALT
jgi:antitoxin HicB